LPAELDTLAARAHLWLDRPDKAEAILARHFSACVDDGDDPAATGVRALLACRRGQLQDAWMLASRTLELAGERQPAPMPAILDGLLARTVVLWERHDLDAAHRPSIPTRADGQEPLLFWPLECQLIQVMISKERPGEAMSRLARLRARLGDAARRQPVAARLDVLGIRCAQMLGVRHPALQALIVSPPGRYPTEDLAWADLRAGRPDRAAARLSSPGDQATSVGAELRRLTLTARALIRLGDERHALATLRRALELGRPGRYVTAFVDDAPELVPLLHRMAGPFPDGYVADVIDHAEQAHGEAGTAHPAAAVEPLSEREHEILTHLPSHRSQGQIAAEMYVSINTVKTHIRAVYRKLGVSSRSAAVAVARAQKLI
jgi:LuxR family maltose regulon positive regulatory protein